MPSSITEPLTLLSTSQSFKLSGMTKLGKYTFYIHIKMTRLLSSFYSFKHFCNSTVIFIPANLLHTVTIKVSGILHTLNLATHCFKTMLWNRTVSITLLEIWNIGNMITRPFLTGLSLLLFLQGDTEVFFSWWMFPSHLLTGLLRPRPSVPRNLIS